MIKIKFLLKSRTLKWSWLIIDTCIFYHPICWFGKVNSHNDEPERFHKNKPLLVNHFQYLEPEPWFHLFSSAWSSYPRRGTDWFFERTPVDTIAVVQGCSHQDMNIPVSGLNIHLQKVWVPGKWKIWKCWSLKKMRWNPWKNHRFYSRLIQSNWKNFLINNLQVQFGVKLKFWTILKKFMYVSQISWWTY